MAEEEAAEARKPTRCSKAAVEFVLTPAMLPRHESGTRGYRDRSRISPCRFDIQQFCGMLTLVEAITITHP